ncbi:putative ribonuclease H-like domain-containing protein [Tanacetum coccineum]
MTKNMTEHAMFSSVQQRTNYKDFQNCLFACFLSQEDPKKVIQALKDPSWIKAMQDELLQFKLQMVWTLVDLPNDKRAIGTKWVYKNKKDERVARIEEISQVYQPPGFEDLDFPDKVYKVEKAFYGLHQAPGAWYETLSAYLLENRYQRGQIDKTLFIKRDQGDILIVQVYVDDIIFGSTKKKLCTEFKKMMHKSFQMSSIGELTFFLGLQVKQKKDGIFISQDKYVTEILKKFGFSDVKTASTPMETHKPLLKDTDGKDVDEHMYRSMIGSLMYLTSLRPDIIAKSTAWNEFSSTMASVIICLATNQKFNFSKYIFESMVKNVDSSDDSNVSKAQEKMGKGSANPIDPHHTPIITQPSTSQPQKKQKPKKPNRKDTKIPQSSGPTEPIADEAANEENVPTHSNVLWLQCEDVVERRLKSFAFFCVITNSLMVFLNFDSFGFFLGKRGIGGFSSPGFEFRFS